MPHDIGAKPCLVKRGSQGRGAGGGQAGACFWLVKRRYTAYIKRMSNKTRFTKMPFAKMPFTKMNGLGNDFVIIDARDEPAFALTAAQVQKLAARDNPDTHGCDQLLVVRQPPLNSGADVFMQIYNHDGSEVEACGNGTRALALFLIKDNIRGRDDLAYNISTDGGDIKSGLLQEYSPENKGALMYAHMPLPKFEWDEIPLAESIDNTQSIVLHDDLPPAFLVNVGNPHAVMFFDKGTTSEALQALAQKYGNALEHHALFPQRANINFAAPTIDNKIYLCTWERGVGITKACGTGAAATAIAAYHLQLGEKKSGLRKILPPSYQECEAENFLITDYETQKGQEKLSVGGYAEFNFDGEASL